VAPRNHVVRPNKYDAKYIPVPPAERVTDVFITTDAEDLCQ